MGRCWVGSSEDFCCTPFNASCLFHGEKEKKRIPDQLCGHTKHEDIFTGVCTWNHSNCGRAEQNPKFTAWLRAYISSGCSSKSWSAVVIYISGSIIAVWAKYSIKQLMTFKNLKSSAAVGWCMLIKKQCWLELKQCEPPPAPTLSFIYSLCWGQNVESYSAHLLNRPDTKYLLPSN